MNPTPLEQPSWDQLCAAEPSVQQAALTDLCHLYQDRMYTFSLFMLDNREAAKDAVQESLLRFIKAIRTVRPLCLPCTYLMRILHNVCIDSLRAQSQQRRSLSRAASADPPSSLAPPSPEAHAIANERRQALYEALLRLPLEARKPVVLRYLCELTNDEAAETLKLRKNTFEVRLHRAIRALAELLRPEDV